MKVLKYIGGGLCAALLLWILMNWTDNSRPNPQHNEYNMFVLMTK